MELSVVIPTRDRPERLLETLSALVSAADPALDWEAVVVDDGGTTVSLEPARALAKETGAPLRFLSQPSRGPAAARNRGARDARGRVLVFLDDDMVTAPGFLGRHLRSVDANPGCWIVGRITHPEALRATPFGRYRHARWEEFHDQHAPRGLQETDGISAANLALPAADLERLHGFDEGFALAGCEDRELALRAQAAGIRILYDPENVALHQDWATTLPRYCERQRSYAISDVRLWRRHGSSSPRAALITASTPVSRADGPRRVLRKLVRRALATVPGRALLLGLASASERVLPDRPLTRRLYEAAVSVAIFRGVRDGLLRYPEASSRP
jgi:GT2 family glycosyltransferase